VLVAVGASRRAQLVGDSARHDSKMAAERREGKWVSCRAVDRAAPADPVAAALNDESAKARPKYPGSCREIGRAPR
jgi:hypothetical protein